VKSDKLQFVARSLMQQPGSYDKLRFVGQAHVGHLFEQFIDVAGSQMIEPAENSFEQTLRDYGVTETALSTAEQEALDREGYVILRDIIDADWLSRLRAAFESGCQNDGGATVVKESGTRHLNDLVNRDPVFEGALTNPRVLAGVFHILRDAFRVGQIGGRDPLPGYGQQGLHADWTARTKGEPFRIVTTSWLLDDFTGENGATRVVPGTHQLLTQPPKSFADPASRHPDQRIIVAKAGSVLVFNGHLWHSGTANKSSSPRRVLQCSFVGRDEFRFSRIKVDNPERLSPAARYLLGT
jgi:ectoine hydroxylase-related dioxygenase (phytanoyl-CoA dioxygenase family)